MKKNIKLKTVNHFQKIQIVQKTIYLFIYFFTILFLFTSFGFILASINMVWVAKVYLINVFLYFILVGYSFIIFYITRILIKHFYEVQDKYNAIMVTCFFVFFSTFLPFVFFYQNSLSFSGFVAKYLVCGEDFNEF